MAVIVPRNADSNDGAFEAWFPGTWRWLSKVASQDDYCTWIAYISLFGVEGFQDVCLLVDYSPSIFLGQVPLFSTATAQPSKRWSFLLPHTSSLPLLFFVPLGFLFSRATFGRIGGKKSSPRPSASLTFSFFKIKLQ